MGEIEFPAMNSTQPAPPTIAGQILTYHQEEHTRTLMVGTPTWYSWLQTATQFTFTSDNATFTARRERASNKRGGWYWRAYHTHHGIRRRVYLGRSAQITPERLTAVAMRFARLDQDGEHERAHVRHHVHAERSDLQYNPSRSLQEPSRRHAESGADSENVSRLSNMLPSPLTSLVGRDQEVDAICGLLARPEVRELTLTGAGGVGKTRLAIAIAARVGDEFPDGICYVSLAALRDADFVLPAIAQAEGLPANRTLSAIDVLHTVLREKKHLLVLDNFEHVVTAGPSLSDLLAGCPHLKLLVTSREVLHVRGEREFVVQPLPLPDPHHLPNEETLSRYGAVALFLERAHEVQPTLALTATTAPLIAQICQRLDGLPLALELAAARLKVLSLGALRERLEHRLQVLTGGPRDLPARQQTLRQTIAWSYDLLAAEEQRLFRLLCVFVGGCTLAGAEAMYGAVGGERAHVLDGVTSLLDKHVLDRREQGDGAVRLLMHETIREYGLEALTASQELAAARQAHAEYYLGLTVTHFESGELVAWLGLLDREYANLHTALQWALERPASEIALRLQSALLHFWQGHRRLGESGTDLTRSATGSTSNPTRVPTGKRFTPAAMAHEQSDVEHDAALGHEMFTLQHEQRDAPHLARSLYLLGAFAWLIGDFAMADSYAEAGLVRARGTEDTITRAYLLDLLGQVALDQGEDRRARTLLEAGLVLHREAGDTLGSLGAYFFLERMLLAQGEVAHARTYAEEHLALAKAIDFRSGTAGALTFLGRLALEEGNAALAHELFEESLALLRAMNENMPLAVATNLQGIGVTLAALGQPAEAVRLWGAAEALCALLPEERAFVARARVAVRAELSQEAFTAAWAEGQAMTLEQALAAVGRAAHSGVLPRQATSNGRSAREPRPFVHDLTEREVEVLRLVARGLTDAQIADALVISRRTVNAHLRSIYRKLNITSRHAATYFALEHDLLMT